MRPLKSIAKSLAKSKTAAKQKKELQAAMKAKSANKVRVRTKLTEGAKKAKNRDYGISRGSGNVIRKEGGPVAKRKSLKRYQMEGEVAETTPTQTPPAVPAATTKTFADTYKANVAAGLNPRKARIEAERELGYVQPKQRVNPNTVIEAIGNTAASAINTAGARRMGMKKGGVTKKTIMKTGGIKKNSAVDPEGNTIKTRENTRTGKTVTKVKYADPKSSGMKRERTVTPGLSRMKRKANEMYAKNPQAAKEDDFTPFKRKGGVSKMKTSGAKKMKKYQSRGEVISGPLNQNEQAMYDRTVTYKDKMPNVDLQKLRNTLVTKGLDEKPRSPYSKNMTKRQAMTIEKNSKMKTGGMVNSNKKASAIKSAGSKGVKSGVNKRATVKRK